MVDRSATWYLIQFTGDLRRREPRNVGVVLQTAEGWHARFIGESEGGIDGRKLRGLGVSKDAYEVWIEHYRRNLSADGWERVLQNPKRRNFVALVGGHDYEAKADWGKELEHLYFELVESPSAEDREPIVDIAARLLQAAQIDADVDFKIKADYGNRQTDEVRWDFAFQNGALHLMDGLRLSGWTAQVQAEAFHARAHAVTSASSAPLDFVCFYDSFDHEGQSADHILKPIEAVATAIDVSREDQALDTLINTLRH